MKKILFFQWNSFMNREIECALQKMSVEYETFFYQFTDWEEDENFLDKFRKKVRGECYACVLSVNFSPLISNVCEELGVRYISWVYDSPIHIRNLEPLRNSCNRIYFFDRGQAENYKKEGIAAFHLPLAVDAELREKVIAQRKKHAIDDISFVGQLYQTEYAQYSGVLPDYLKGYLEGIINAQSKVYGGYLLDELLTDKLLEEINDVYAKVTNDKFQIEKRELEYMLNCEITWRERYMALSLLANKYQVCLYAPEKYELHSNMKQNGYVNYYEEMPYVFANSKINLNISLKSIRTGIPLRVLDILGCGGFLITNFQEELLDYFSIGEDIEVYTDLGDLREKADFYLKNDEIRKQIAESGLRKVKKEFTFEQRMEQILKNI